MALKLVEENLSGSEIVTRIRKGHAVRRAAWIDDLYVRICNESGFDEDGNAIQGELAPFYTHSTRGYFLHVGFSSQQFREPRVWLSSYGYWSESTREGEGFGILFEDDWEDYGFIEGKVFNVLTEALKDKVKENYAIAIEKAIDKAIEEYKKNPDGKPVCPECNRALIYRKGWTLCQTCARKEDKKNYSVSGTP
jgi:hypothetical protein